ncbi:MAG: hypothetical protein K0S01_314 [Herbinix sp.]|jgi:hypothetical protein|nr:hypothetical protein [Herbinix sp.]
MAGVITHMVIAREIIKLLPENTIVDQGLFYLGNLAPDAIHARADYERAYKKHTHFRDDILDMEFGQEDNLAIFHGRLIDFINDNKGRKDGLLDLYRGYVVHILTDELFMLTVRKEFCALMEEQGIAQNDKRFFEYIVTDMNRNDLLLVENYEGSSEIRHLMEEVPIYPIENYLSKQEIEISRDWLIHRHFIEAHESLEPRFISYERNWQFIQMAVVSIIEKLTKGDCFPTIL